MLSRLGELDLGHLIDNLGQCAVTFTVSVNMKLMKGFFSGRFNQTFLMNKQYCRYFILFLQFTII